MASQQTKVLRIGVIQGGKIVDELVLPARQPVTIGSSPRNTIVVPLANMPESYLVFSYQADHYVLQLEEGRSVPVTDDERGKVVLGEVTLLWQFVAPPAEVAQPTLPKEAKGAHFKSMDRLFVSVLAISFLVHSGAYAALARAKLPSEVTLEEIPDRYAKLLIPERHPRPPPKPEERKPEVVAEQKPETKDPEKRDPEKKQETPEQVARRKATRAAAVAQAVQSKGILKVLGALGPATATGAVADVFGSAGGMDDVATALSGAGGVAVASDPGAGAARKGGSAGGAASIGSLATTGGGKVGLGTKTEVRVSGSVAAEEADVDSSDIDPGKLGAFVRARMGLIKACYENALKRNPGLKGKISIRFTILATGGLADVASAQNTVGSPEVAACIVSTMRSWRTQFRPPGPVTVEYPFVFQPLN